MDKFNKILAGLGIGFVLCTAILLNSVLARQIEFGGGYVLDVEKVYNTDECLTDCYLELKLSLNQDYLIDNLNKFRVRFAGRIGAELIDYKFLIKKNITTEREIWIVDSVNCYPETDDGVEIETCDETGHYETIYIYNDVWDTFSPLGKTMRADKDYYIRIAGKRKPTTEIAKIDAIPTLFEQDLPEYDYWNSSWAECGNITITENSGYNLIDQAIIINATGLTFSSTDEIRIVNAGCNETGDEITRDIISSGLNYAEIVFLANLTASTTHNFSVYYNNPLAPAPIYTDRVQFDNDCTVSDCTINITTNRHEYGYTIDHDAGTFDSGYIISSGNDNMISGASYDLIQFYNGAGWIFYQTITTNNCELEYDGYIYGFVTCKAGISNEWFNYTFFANDRINLNAEIISNPVSAEFRLGTSPHNLLDRAYDLYNVLDITGVSQNVTCDNVLCTFGSYDSGITYPDFVQSIWNATIYYSNHSFADKVFSRIGGFAGDAKYLGSGIIPFSFFYNPKGDYTNSTVSIYRNYQIYMNPPSLELDLLIPEEPSGPDLNLSNLTIEFTIDASNLGSISRSTCESSEWLRSEFILQDCISEQEGYTPNCYNYTRYKLSYCANGCYENVTENGAGCSPPDYFIYIFGFVVLLIGIAFISWMYGRGR